MSGQFDGREHIIVLLPGPPHELKGLFENEVRERLRAKVPSASLAIRTLKIAMLGESAVDARVAPIYKRYADVETTILAGAGEIELHFKTSAATLDAAQRRVDEVAGVVEDELDDAVYSRDGESLEQIVGLLAADAQRDRGRSGVLYRRASGGKTHVHQRQLALFSWRGRRVFQCFEDRTRWRSCRND